MAPTPNQVGVGPKALLLLLLLLPIIAADWIHISQLQTCSQPDMQSSPALAVIVQTTVVGQPHRCVQLPSGSGSGSSTAAYEYTTQDKSIVMQLQCNAACTLCSPSDQLLLSAAGSLSPSFCGMVFRTVSLQGDLQDSGLRDLIKPWGIWATLSNRSLVVTSYQHLDNTASSNSSPQCSSNPIAATQHYLVGQCVHLNTTHSFKSAPVGQNIQQQICRTPDCSLGCTVVNVLVNPNDLSRSTDLDALSPSAVSPQCVRSSINLDELYGPIELFDTLSKNSSDSMWTGIGLSIPVIACIAMGALFLLLILGNAIWMTLRRRSRQHQPLISLAQHPQTPNNRKLVWYNIVSASQASLLNTEVGTRASTELQSPAAAVPSLAYSTRSSAAPSDPPVCNTAIKSTDVDPSVASSSGSTTYKTTYKPAVCFWKTLSVAPTYTTVTNDNCGGIAAPNRPVAPSSTIQPGWNRPFSRKKLPRRLLRPIELYSLGKSQNRPTATDTSNEQTSVQPPNQQPQKAATLPRSTKEQTADTESVAAATEMQADGDILGRMRVSQFWLLSRDQQQQMRFQLSEQRSHRQSDQQPRRATVLSIAPTAHLPAAMRPSIETGANNVLVNIDTPIIDASGCTATPATPSASFYNADSAGGCCPTQSTIADLPLLMSARKSSLSQSSQKKLYLARRRFAAELIGTFMLVTVATGTVLSAVVAGALKGIWQSAVAVGITLACCIYITLSTSGGHLNPAFTLAMAVFTSKTSFPWARVPAYITAQVLGAALAGCVNLVIWDPLIAQFETHHSIIRNQLPGCSHSAMLFGMSFPNPDIYLPTLPDSASLVSPWRALSVEIIATAIHTLIVFGLCDRSNRHSVAPCVMPAAVGAMTAALISVFAPISMAAMNPARDFGPRIAAALGGWGGCAFGSNGSFLVYIFGPCLGAIIGAAVYFYVLCPSDDELKEHED
ncbi:hypothetical protein BASA61_001906 [Batrachochytrium salamandrivorans]|nr:hypothetical protein BASA60_005275 [Batrachochytrium salamandrivorans]KAH6601702.1 hypothetical protein BASA61_001906 [Batrachochytrium salamandrivorans]